MRRCDHWRRDNGQKYDEYLKDLAKAAGIENPTREELARLDRKRKKKGSNKEWKNPYGVGPSAETIS